MTDANIHGDNRFERHPVLTWGLITLIILMGVELVLRLFEPEALRFARELRHVFRYHDRWYTDYEPDTTTTVRLSDEHSGYYLNFLLTINEHGFRWHDRVLDAPLPDPVAKRLIHTIGDSFTMGWGVNYESSYPAQLQELLSPEFAVLNLGMSGYGVIGATEKSLTLAEVFPPSAVIYLATGNDYSDDEVAASYAAKPAIVHRFFDGLNVVRRHVYLPNIWYAVRWHLYYRSRDQSEKQLLDPRGVSIRQHALTDTSDPKIGQRSKAALSAFVRTLRARDVPLIVIAHGANSRAIDIARFSAELDVPSYLIDFPEALTLHREGHLNRVGNTRMAEYVLALLRLNGVLETKDP